ncbi:glutaredoxin [Acidaminobacter sp. JC074]|uniref:glutaredoxin domain-containing protein n=1 Tax=Acidaminobacter sp. JC074 TaxID=2530199 RepID=UPI001F0FA55B|nr:glutaredoxin domain-containing protein [Acidaminobacter sp. JC074]MCH4887759.1 glutaredoxin [Acidaminobacter sp. JC074]
MKAVKIWTFKTCPFCIKAKKLLDELNVEYEEIMIPFGDDRLNELAKETGCTTLPQIFVEGDFIGDCSKIHELNDQGLLMPMIEG